MPAKFCDPIVYKFTFRCVTMQPVDDSIKKAVKDLLLPLKSYVLRYTGFDKDIPGIGFMVWCHKYADQYTDAMKLPNANIFIPTRAYTAEQASELYEQRLDLFVKNRYPCMIIEGGERSTLTHFSEPPTALAKEYKLWLAGGKDSLDFQNNKTHICQLTSCPSEDLHDVLFPLIMYYGQMMFKINYQSYSMTNNEIAELNRTDRRIKVRIPEEEKDRPHYLHEIQIAIPRFVIGKTTETALLQQNWIDILKRLGEKYPLSIGAIDLDTPFDIVHGSYSCYDSGLCNDSGIRYMSDCIPGYAWALLINSDQANGLPKNDDCQMMFYEKTTFENGNVYFQKTHDVRKMTWQDCNDLRQYFRDCLPDVTIQFNRERFPPSLRLGFLENEIVFDNLKDVNPLFGIRNPYARKK